MATYPLKNISIGGNTYQIQGGGGGDTMYAFVFNNAQTDPLNFNHTSINVSSIDTIKTSDGTYGITTVSDIVQSCCNAAPAYPCGFHYVPDAYVGDEVWFNMKSITYTSSGYYECTFESKVMSGYVLQIVLTVDNTPGSEALLSCYGEKITLGGGGSPVLAAMNGSSLPGNLTDLAHISANAQFYIWAKADDTTLMSLADITNLLKNGPVQMKDQTGYVSIGLRDSSTIWFMRPVDDFSPIKMIYCTYSSSTQKWTVSAVKQITAS